MRRAGRRGRGGARGAAGPDRYLTDLAGVVPESAGGWPSRPRSQRSSSDTGHQVIAVLFPSLEGESLEDFTIRCAERWKVGRKGLDDGVIFFAFLDDRRMRLEVGYGLEEKVPDALAGRLLDDVVKPAFARGDYGGGVIALAGALEGDRSAASRRPTPAANATAAAGSPSLTLSCCCHRRCCLRAAAAWAAGGGPWRGFGGWGGGGGFGGGGASAAADFPAAAARSEAEARPGRGSRALARADAPRRP